jgi:hypothetical protein
MPIRPSTGFQTAYYYKPPARFGNNEFDTPVFFMQNELALALVSLLGPSASFAPEYWAINKRAFEIVRDSLVVGGEAESLAPSKDVDLQTPASAAPRRQPRFPDAGSY